MKNLDFDFTYEEWPGSHDWYFFNEALKKALNLCFARLSKS
jgi:putative tributyrin esterase